MTPLANWLTDPSLQNWSGNIAYSTNRLYPAQSARQVGDFVRSHEKLKVLGTRHCFNTIADSTHNLLSLTEMEPTITVDAPAQTVTVNANLKYGVLATELDRRGFALHNLASLPHISVAGACATATHGSGVDNGNLATAVRGMELVLANGETRVLRHDTDGDAFRAAVVHLGALGVVTKVTLAIQPTYQMRQYVYENLPLDQLTAHFDAIVSAGYSVSLFTDWQQRRINEVWLKQRVGPGDQTTARPDFFGAALATKNLHPIAELSAVNCTEQLGVPGPWYERLPHFRMGFTPSSGKELQSEYFVPRRNGMEAILAIERLRDQISPHLMISELRTIAADDLWLSPCYKQPSLAIHFTWKPDWASVKKVLPVIERELMPFGARPHWGKLFTMAPARLQQQYEKMPDFKALVAQYDPNGKFRNTFLDTNLFSH